MSHRHPACAPHCTDRMIERPYLPLNDPEKVMQQATRFKISNHRLALYLALIHVILATAYAYVAVQYMLENWILTLILLPGSFFAGLIFFTEPNPLIALLISQSIAFAIVYGFLWITFKGLRDDGR